jgi:hypothetical protein
MDIDIIAFSKLPFPIRRGIAKMPYLFRVHGVLLACIALAPAGAFAQLCPAGSFSATGSAPCQLADPGSYVPHAGATSEIKAQLGAYVPNAGAVLELPARAGFYVIGTGATAETEAPPGSYAPIQGMDSPIPASPGHIVPNTMGVPPALPGRQ